LTYAFGNAQSQASVSSMRPPPALARRRPRPRCGSNVTGIISRSRIASSQAKRRNASRPTINDVLADGRVVGRIMKAAAVPVADADRRVGFTRRRSAQDRDNPAIQANLFFGLMLRALASRCLPLAPSDASGQASSPPPGAWPRHFLPVFTADGRSRAPPLAPCRSMIRATGQRCNDYPVDRFRHLEVVAPANVIPASMRKAKCVLAYMPCGPDRAARPCRLLDHLVSTTKQRLPPGRSRIRVWCYPAVAR